MDEMLARLWQNLGDRITGPMSFRLVLQPIVAAILAVRGGLQDARSGRPAYFWTMLTADRATRRRLVRQGWKSIAKVFCLAIALDVTYEIVAGRWIYPGETLLVAFLLACAPYLLIRGPVNRLVRTSVAAARTDHP